MHIFHNLKIKFNEWKANFKWTKRKVALIILPAFLIVFATISFLPETFFLGAPPIQYFSNHTGVGFQIPPLPAVTFSQNVIFTAIGSFSVNNPVHVKIILNNVNTTDFLSYHNRVGFLNGYPLSIEIDPTQITPDIQEIELKEDKTYSGIYVGEGDIRWLKEGPTYLCLLPNHTQNIKPVVLDLDSLGADAPSVITITGVSDTLSTHFSEATAKIAWQIGTFSIIILEPILEAILVKEEKPAVTIPEVSQRNLPSSKKGK